MVLGRGRESKRSLGWERAGGKSHSSLGAWFVQLGLEMLPFVGFGDPLVWKSPLRSWNTSTTTGATSREFLDPSRDGDSITASGQLFHPLRERILPNSRGFMALLLLLSHC